MDDNACGNGAPPLGGPRNRATNGSGYADRPYRVGKGKPPVEHQFRKGGPSPHPQGRPRGSTRTSSLEKLLRKKITVTDKNGRRVRKTIGEVIDHKLVELAAGGDLKAIRLVKDIEFQLLRFGFINQPTLEEMKRLEAEEEEKRALAEQLTEHYAAMLQLETSMKKMGLLVYVNGRPAVETWVVQVASERRAASLGEGGLKGSANWVQV